MNTKQTIVLMAAATLLFQGLPSSSLEAFSIQLERRIGPGHRNGEDHSGHGHQQRRYIYFYPNNRDYYDDDDDYYDDDDDRSSDSSSDDEDVADTNFKHEDSSSIQAVSEPGGDSTRLDLENGMTFMVDAHGMGWSTGTTVNVFSKRNSSGLTEYKLRIEGLDFRAYPMEE